MMNTTITAVPGVHVGHATLAGVTGCTVLVGPFRGAVDIRGLATGTRELDALSPTHVVPQLDALLLTGGSALGLAAADGVMQWLREQGRGFDTGTVRIPIVPAAVIFDIKSVSQPTPDAAMGRAACVAATSDAVSEGRVGAGTGATVGKLRGLPFASPGGVGSSAARHGDYTVGAIVIVNAVGDVLDYDGRIMAGARADDGSFVDTMQVLRSGVSAVNAPATNTTIAAIATDAPLTRTALQMLARMGSSAVVRRIAPANTIYDGDVVFSLSTSESAREFASAELMALSVAAQLVLEAAIIRAVQPTNQ